MTIDEILENDNILADRFGMAAISYIFKAFGDNIRSKEYWPWSEKVNCPWVGSKGTENDILTAIKILNKAIEAIQNENTISKRIEDKSIKKLKERLTTSKTNIQKSNDVTDKINDTTDDTLTKILRYDYE